MDRKKAIQLWIALLLTFCCSRINGGISWPKINSDRASQDHINDYANQARGEHRNINRKRRDTTANADQSYTISGTTSAEFSTNPSNSGTFENIVDQKLAMIMATTYRRLVALAFPNDYTRIARLSFSTGAELHNVTLYGLRQFEVSHTWMRGTTIGSTVTTQGLEMDADVVGDGVTVREGPHPLRLALRSPVRVTFAAALRLQRGRFHVQKLAVDLTVRTPPVISVRNTSKTLRTSDTSPEEGPKETTTGAPAPSTAPPGPGDPAGSHALATSLNALLQTRFERIVAVVNARLADSLAEGLRRRVNVRLQHVDREALLAGGWRALSARLRAGAEWVAAAAHHAATWVRDLIGATLF